MDPQERDPEAKKKKKIKGFGKRNTLTVILDMKVRLKIIKKSVYLDTFMKMVV